MRVKAQMCLTGTEKRAYRNSGQDVLKRNGCLKV
jgi:hypothetical protein